MTSNAMNSRVSLGMIIEGWGNRFKNILAGSLTPEEKLSAIVEEMGRDVAEKRVLARQIRAKMSAIADPDTATLEPLEAAKARRQKLVDLGGKLLAQSRDPQNVDRVTALQTQMKQVSIEVQSVTQLIDGQQATYDTLKESYDLAFATYQQALSAFEQARDNGPAILDAIRAHEDALKVRDQARAGAQKRADASFLTDLQKELSGAQANLRADKELENDLDATNPHSVDAMLAADEATHVEDSLMAEFEAAAAKRA